jgi:polysaccharide export outer membrane protein
MSNSRLLVFALVCAAAPVAAAAQDPRPAVPAPGAPMPTGVTLPSGYVIGTDDVLSVVFWKDTDMSAEVTVRPDGKISLPLLNDVPAAGLSPDQLRANLMEAAKKFVTDPTVTIVVKTINSRKIFITGNVARPGAYLLTGTMSALQLIAMAGGVLEYADTKNIVITRSDEGGQKAFPFNYNDVKKGKNLKQNIELKPGDTVIVP